MTSNPTRLARGLADEEAPAALGRVRRQVAAEHRAEAARDREPPDQRDHARLTKEGGWHLERAEGFVLFPGSDHVQQLGCIIDVAQRMRCLRDATAEPCLYIRWMSP